MLQKEREKKQRERDRKKREGSETPAEKAARRAAARQRREESQKDALERKFKLRDKKEEAREAARRLLREEQRRLKQQNWLMLCQGMARLQFWLDVVMERRQAQQDAAFASQHGAANCIARCVRHFLWRKHVREFMGGRTTAATRLQRFVRLRNLSTGIARRVKGAEAIRIFLRESRKMNVLQVLVKKTRHQYVLLQRWWRTVLHMRRAEMEALCRQWDCTKEHYVQRKAEITERLKQLKQARQADTWQSTRQRAQQPRACAAGIHAGRGTAGWPAGAGAPLPRGSPLAGGAVSHFCCCSRRRGHAVLLSAVLCGLCRAAAKASRCPRTLRMRSAGSWRCRMSSRKSPSSRPSRRALLPFQYHKGLPL